MCIWWFERGGRGGAWQAAAAISAFVGTVALLNMGGRWARSGCSWVEAIAVELKQAVVGGKWVQLGPWVAYGTPW